MSCSVLPASVLVSGVRGRLSVCLHMESEGKSGAGGSRCILVPTRGIMTPRIGCWSMYSDVNPEARTDRRECGLSSGEYVVEPRELLNFEFVSGHGWGPES